MCIGDSARTGAGAGPQAPVLAGRIHPLAKAHVPPSPPKMQRSGGGQAPAESSGSHDRPSLGNERDVSRPGSHENALSPEARPVPSAIPPQTLPVNPGLPVVEPIQDLPAEKHVEPGPELASGGLEPMADWFLETMGPEQGDGLFQVIMPCAKETPETPETRRPSRSWGFGGQASGFQEGGKIPPGCSLWVR